MKRILSVFLAFAFALTVMVTPVYAATNASSSSGDEVIIGLTYTNDKLYQVIKDYGAKPVYLDNVTTVSAAKKKLKNVSAILIPGGGDINPRLYGYKNTYSTRINNSRDKKELCYCKAALAMNMPILGVCRGHQMLNVASGGSLYQDIEKYKMGKAATHKDGAKHSITVNKGTILYDAVKETFAYVNSYHHQCVKRAGNHIRVSARNGKVIEAIERNDKTFAVGVQYHLETAAMLERVETKRLLTRFVREARNYEKKKRR